MRLKLSLGALSWPGGREVVDTHMRMTRRRLLKSATALLAGAGAAPGFAVSGPLGVGEPHWIGIELRREDSPKYVGVMCVDQQGEVLHLRELAERHWALERIAEQWGRGMRILATQDELLDGARDCQVFGAVVDVASPTATQLAERLADRVRASSSGLGVCVLDVVSTLPGLRHESMKRGAIVASRHFDVTIHTETLVPWFEHRDLARLCALQYEGLIEVDFGDVLGALKGNRRAGCKIWTTAYGPDRAQLATGEIFRKLARCGDTESVRAGILLVTANIETLRLAEIRTAAHAVQGAFPSLESFVLGHCSHHPSIFLMIDLLLAWDSA